MERGEKWREGKEGEKEERREGEGESRREEREGKEGNGTMFKEKTKPKTHPMGLLLLSACPYQSIQEFRVPLLVI